MMLTALAHLILACSRSRSLIADSIRDEPEKWIAEDDIHFRHEPSGLRIWTGGLWVYLPDNPRHDHHEMTWAEGRLVRHAIKQLSQRAKAKAARKFDKALKAALTGDE